VRRPRRRVDRKAYDQVRAQFDGTKRADAALVRSIGMDPRHFAPCKRTRHREAPPAAVGGADDANVDIPVNGNLPGIPALQPTVDRLGLTEASAQRHRLEKREVIALFWRTGAAHLGEGVRHNG
jgi:hypothetical protein